MSTIVLKNVTKNFGNLKAVDDISATIEENKIYGLLGRNGAGKSTLLNLISNRLIPSFGEILVDGEKATDNDNAQSKIYCMSDRNLYPIGFKVIDIFKYTKLYYPSFNMDYALKLCNMYNLSTKKKLKALSTGFLSICKLITALSVNTPIVLFDEPVLGLDANNRDMFYRQLLNKYNENPSTYIISTHLIEEATDIVEKVLIIKDGKLIIDEDTQELVNKGFTITGPAAVIDEFCNGRNKIGEDIIGGLKSAYILGKIAESEIPQNTEIAKLDLQKLFIELTNA